MSQESRFYEKYDKPLFAAYHNTSESKIASKDFHFHDQYEIYLFLGGKAEAFVEQSKYPLEHGSILIFNNMEIHKTSNLSSEPYQRISIHFSKQLMQPVDSIHTNLLECFQNHKPGIGNAAILQLQELDEFRSAADKLIEVLSSKKYGKDVLSIAYLTELLVLTNTIFRSSKTISPVPMLKIISDVMAYIDQNLDSHLTLEDLSKQLSISKFYLCHQFKEQTGSSLYNYIIMRKLALSRKLLSDGCSVSDVCENAGFNDYNNFIKIFKKYIGISPAKYKKY